MKQEQLNEILEKHAAWLRDEAGGERANLRGANLSRADLFDANLTNADLFGANLYGANLSRADLRGANLFGADLCDANLRHANLFGADLCDANPSRADLRGANLSRADLRGANLFDANLRGANLYGAKTNYLTTGYHLACPETGAFEAWKKLDNQLIAHLRIPADARRSSATTRKCRAERAEVLGIYDTHGNAVERGQSQRGNLEYVVGEIAECDKWDEDRWNECSGGIHFFMTRGEAEAW